MIYRAKVLTAGQSCADWFLMREFRLTSTPTAKFLLRSPQYRIAVGLPPAEPLSDSPSQVLETLTQCLQDLEFTQSKSWFSNSRSTEEMTRGTVNENAVINAFAQHSYIDCVYKVGMFCDKERSWLAASPDAIAAFNIDACIPYYAPSDEPVNLRLAVVEIKTAVARGTVAAGSNIASPELILCDMDTDLFREYVPKGHAAQMVRQCVATNTRWFFYIYTSESQILYVVLSRCQNEFVLDIQNFYDDKVAPALRWAHADNVGNKLLTGNTETDSLISARLPFWRMVSKDIYLRGPFVPVHIFKHASQTLYNKTKGGVDGNTQMRALLRCPSDTFAMGPKGSYSDVEKHHCQCMDCVEAASNAGFALHDRGIQGFGPVS